MRGTFFLGRRAFHAQTFQITWRLSEFSAKQSTHGIIINISIVTSKNMEGGGVFLCVYRLSQLE